MHLSGLGFPAVSTLLVVSPAGAERMGNVELVQESAREVPHQPCKRGLAAVKGRHEGHDAGPGPGLCPSEELCGHKCQRGVNAVVDRFVRISPSGVSQVQKPPGAFNLQILQPAQLNLFARRDLVGLF